MNEGNIPGKNEALISLILGIVGLVVALFVNGIFGMILGTRLVILNAKEQTPRRTTGASSIAFIFLYHKNRKMQEKRG